MRSLRSSLSTSFLAAAALLLSGQVAAATLQLYPTQLYLQPSAPIAAVTMNNSASLPSIIRLKVMAWSQVDGADVLVPTSDVVAVPPLFSLPGKSSQVLRIALRSAAPRNVEGSYRLIVQEVPGPASRASASAISVLLNFSVPVFAAPSSVSAAPLKWTFKADGSALKLSLENPRNVHVQVTHLSLSVPDAGHPLFDGPVYGYALPGQVHSWTLPVGDVPAGQVLELTAQTNLGVLHASVFLLP